MYGLSNKRIIKSLLDEPEKELEAISCDKEWEDRLDYATVLKVDSQYIMYYRAINYVKAPFVSYCYAVSTDGIHWDKPQLNLFSFNDSKENNIISNEIDGVSVTYVGGYYWMIADRLYDENNKVIRGLRLFGSSDGIHFYRDSRLKVPYFCDSQNEILWDETSKTFKLYLRSWYKSQIPTIDYHHTHRLYRSVSLLEIPKLDYELSYSENPLYLQGKTEPPSLNKELPVVLKNNSQSCDFDVYCAYVHKYRDSLYIAYPINYYHTDDKKRGGKSDNDGYATIGFWTSKDGRKFKEIKRDYISGNNTWIEFCVGHIETDKMFIHYFIKYSGTHGTQSDKNAIWARIHYKKHKK
jgi:hypothetical protein